jgi:hypothetical protein
MRQKLHATFLSTLTLLSAVVLGATVTSAGASAAIDTQALIMGGTGTPSPADEIGYIPNVSSYYIFPNTSCHADNCALVSVTTPETAWPLYGGLSALTWKDSIDQGVIDFDNAFREHLAASPTDKFVLFGYSQSGAILAIEKRALASDPTIDQSQIEFNVIGNVSRPNGGLNVRLPFSIPIVNFPYGPSMPTDTQMATTDIALKWDIIADAPTYVTNPIAMFNALLGGPGFGIVHGTYPNPEGDPPTGLVAGYTQAEWQAIMDDPEAVAAAHPDIVNVQYAGDTKYVTVTPKRLPLVAPLDMIGLSTVADLLQPPLATLIEETGYNRTIPYGQPTPFKLIPIFNPVTVAIDVAKQIPVGIQNALNDLGGSSPSVPTLFGTPSTSPTASATPKDSTTSSLLSTLSDQSTSGAAPGGATASAAGDADTTPPTDTGSRGAAALGSATRTDDSKKASPNTAGVKGNSDQQGKDAAKGCAGSPGNSGSTDSRSAAA